MKECTYSGRNTIRRSMARSMRSSLSALRSLFLSDPLRPMTSARRPFLPVPIRSDVLRRFGSCPSPTFFFFVFPAIFLRGPLSPPVSGPPLESLESRPTGDPLGRELASPAGDPRPPPGPPLGPPGPPALGGRCCGTVAILTTL
jgi:hypothetical protein